MSRALAGTTCPQCHQPAPLTNGGRRLGEHKTDLYVLGQAKGGRRRQRCVYSGGTWEDAKAGIPPLRRVVNDRLREVEARGELTPGQHAWLDQHGIPENTHA